MGLGHMAEVVFHRRLLRGSFGGVVKGGCLPGTEEWTCSTSGTTIVGVRGKVAAGVEFLGTLMGVAWSKVRSRQRLKMVKIQKFLW